MAGTIENATDFGSTARNWLESLGKDAQQGLDMLADKLGLDGLVSDLDQLLARPSILDKFLPSAERATAPKPQAAQTYSVKKGDTLGAIAARTGNSVEGLARLNGLANPNKLSVGQVLKLDHAPRTGQTQATRTRQAAASAPAGDTTSTSGLSQKGMDFLYNHEAQKGVSNHLHWPKAASGVTLGPGYDMKGRSAAEIERDLTAIGVDPSAARKAGEGAGLTGATARDFAATNKDLISLTADQEKTLLRQTVAPYAAAVKNAVKVPVTQNQFDALVSFAYNIGTGQDGFKGSTALSRLNDGDTAGAAEAMGWWNKSDGKVSQGLINRRADEVELFNTPGAPFAAAAAPVEKAAALIAGAISPDALAATIATKGDAQARADLAAGNKVVVALRTDTDTGANGGKGVYDDQIAVVWKDDVGRYQAKLFEGNTEPSGQYAWDGPKASRGSHTDMNGDGKMDLGRLQTGTIRYQQQSGEFLGNTFFRATRTQVAERDTNQDGRFTATDTNRIDRSGAGTSMLIHQGGASNTWSAGCQTIPKAQFDDFVAALGGQKAFSYVLVDGR
ncbi:glycoside hydrolase family protein [Sphingobium sp. BYY-5]|uniref:glycoside hydrolase family protein n=1 Tax=Sphingobium sp. BYY-5 TaxID=2926400 RepID=UPI001FA78EA0|nr:glycoside hydrolase family protein [Sphingobium sp. BYY-5]MCI4592607.1 glycoside hydrolase family protein [Sphingobium sp. BYY-5]